ncbi:DUF1833 family protein [Endozoicomonas sp. SCSIO W0465]|uniref:DUF1833 family protein n=1 Tax=Endozoicomonas sp. SCSIO W0465 TaxID=2918516 RepID=UPI002075764B|nr:DUF1833 family protein [Endozoicomonas sp. SCSIO W0465]USE39253.1 DUF1833 domain-containing protein [Endozoicomonas sp. SCSIO W0465]
MTPAEKEAYANADDTRIMLYTLELMHPQFTQPLRIVADNDPLTAEIETGDTVEFTPFFFSIKRPPISEEPDPSLQITVDNVSGFMTPYLDIASRSGDSIQVVFRPYLVDEGDDRITRLSSIKLAIRNASATMTSVTLTAAHINPANLPFPKENYTSDRFPGLS